jgi:hypothetical protein
MERSTQLIQRRTGSLREQVSSGMNSIVLPRVEANKCTHVRSGPGTSAPPAITRLCLGLTPVRIQIRLPLPSLNRYSPHSNWKLMRLNDHVSLCCIALVSAAPRKSGTSTFVGLCWNFSFITRWDNNMHDKWEFRMIISGLRICRCADVGAWRKVKTKWQQTPKI